MRRKRMVVVVGVIVILSLIMGACAKPPETPVSTPTGPATTTPTKPSPTATAPPTQPAQTFTWRMASISPAATHPVSQHEQWFINLVDKRTNGRLKIQQFLAGEIVQVAEVLEAVGRGTAEIGTSFMGYNVGVLPYGDVVADLPMSWRNFGERWQAFHMTGLEALHERELAKLNVQYITQFINGPFGLLTNKPVNTLNDMKGLKVRTSGIMLKLVENYGASGVFIPMGEVYTGLQLGTVNGVITAYDSHYSMKLYEVGKYMMQPPLLATHVLEMYCNKDAYNKLPDDLKATLRWCAANFENYMEANWLVQEQGLIESLKAKGVQFITLPDSDVAQLRTTAVKLWDSEVGTKNAVAAEAVGILKDFLKKQGAIQ